MLVLHRRSSVPCSILYLQNELGSLRPLQRLGPAALGAKEAYLSHFPLAVTPKLTHNNRWKLSVLGSCHVPDVWHGEYFHLGFSSPLVVAGDGISEKGVCIENTGSQFIMEDSQYGEKCWRCMNIFRKHHNVLQYKESK